MRTFFIAANSPRLQQTANPERLLRQDIAAALGTLPNTITFNCGRYAGTTDGFQVVLTDKASHELGELGYLVMKYQELPYAV